MGLGLSRRSGIAFNINRLIAPSESWANAGFIVTGATKASITGNELTLQATAASALHGIYTGAATVPASSLAFLSVEAKAGTYTVLGLSLHNGATTAGNESIKTYNLSTGGLLASYNTAPQDSGVIDVDGTWRRYWMSFVISTTTANPTFWLMDTSRDPRVAWLATASNIVLRKPKLELVSLSAYAPS